MDEEILNVALDMVLEWGENFGKPVMDRLRARFPDLTPAEAEHYDKIGRDIKSAAYNIVEKAYIATKSAGDSAAAIRAKYPLLSDDNISHLISQGMYYAWHDNG